MDYKKQSGDMNIIEEEDSHTQQERESINNEYEGKIQKVTFADENQEKEIQSEKSIRDDNNYGEEEEIDDGYNKNQKIRIKKNLHKKEHKSESQSEDDDEVDDQNDKGIDEGEEESSSYLEEDNYIVEKILKKRIHNKKCEYYVKWQGFPSSKNTWEPLQNLANVIDMIYQFEYDFPQTGKQPKVPKKLLKDLCHTQIERIFGHDKIGTKSQYLVSYSGISKPQWVIKHDLPIGYLKQYNNCLQNNTPQCVLHQIKQNKEQGHNKAKEEVKQKGRKSKDIENEKDTSLSKKGVNNDLFSSIDEDDREIAQTKPKRQYIKRKNIITDQESSQSSKPVLKRKNVFQDKSFQDSINDNSQQQFAYQQDDSIVSENTKKKLKSSDQQSEAIDNSKSSQLELRKQNQENEQVNKKQKEQIFLSNNHEIEVEKDISKINQNLDKSDILFDVKRESCVNDTQRSDSGNYPKEGSFENNDKVQRVIIRSSEKELEAMIFEVFWKPRADCTQPKSKLVRYGELKRYSPESLIYWLEVMVKNSVKELENDDQIIKDLKDQIQMYQQQIQNIHKQPPPIAPPPSQHLNAINQMFQPKIREQMQQMQQQIQEIQQNEVININGEDKFNTQQPQYFMNPLQNIHMLQNKSFPPQPPHHPHLLQQHHAASQKLMNYNQNGNSQFLFPTSNFIPPNNQITIEQPLIKNVKTKQPKKEDGENIQPIQKKKKGRPKKDEQQQSLTITIPNFVQ